MVAPGRNTGIVCFGWETRRWENLTYYDKLAMAAALGSLLRALNL